MVLGIIVVTVILRVAAAPEQAAEPSTALAPTAATNTPVAGWPDERVLALPPGLGDLVAVESAGGVIVLRYQAAGADTVLVLVDPATGAQRGVLRLKQPAN